MFLSLSVLFQKQKMKIWFLCLITYCFFTEVSSSRIYYSLILYHCDNIWAGNLLFPPLGIAQSLPYHFSTPVAQGRYVLQQHTGSPNQQLLHQQQNAADYSPFAPVTSSTVITATTGASGTVGTPATRLTDGAMRPAENTTGGSSKIHSGNAHTNNQTTGKAPWLWTLKSYYFYCQGRNRFRPYSSAN